MIDRVKLLLDRHAKFGYSFSYCMYSCKGPNFGEAVILSPWDGGVTDPQKHAPAPHVTVPNLVALGKPSGRKLEKFGDAGAL